MAPILRLYPPPQETLPLEGTYLQLNLHRQGTPERPLIYSNYIASLDGRISVKDAETGEFVVPDAIANKRDWRLYQELAAQCDVLITSARYFRQLAKDQAQDMLPVGKKKEYADLLEFRHREGLSDQPAVIILSRSLDIPLKALDRISDRDIYVLTTMSADESKVAQLTQHGVQCIRADTDNVSGHAVKAALTRLGFGSAYMIAGPELHATLLDAGVLNRLFLTTHHSLIGGDQFHTIASGRLTKAGRMSLVSLYLDDASETGQVFAQYEVISD